MMIDEKSYIIYGITPLMQKYIKDGLDNLNKCSLIDIFLWIHKSNELTEGEKSIIIFEIGRKYGDSNAR